MGRVLERKDHTSIYIPSSKHVDKKQNRHYRFLELLLAVSLLTIGSWLILTI